MFDTTPTPTSTPTGSATGSRVQRPLRRRRYAMSTCAALISTLTIISTASTATAAPTDTEQASEQASEQGSARLDAAGKCAELHVVYANGTFDSSTVDDPNNPRGFFGQLNNTIQADARAQGLATRELDGTLNSPITASAVNYNASAGGALLPGVNAKYAADATTYRESMTNGVQQAVNQIRQVAQSCDDTLFMLAGYSQGAEVIETVARRIGHGKGPVDADRVVGVSLFASPTRQADLPQQAAGNSSVSTGENVEKVTEGLAEYPTPAGGGLSVDKSGAGDLGELADRTVSWCLNGDLVCGLPVDSDEVRSIVDAAEDADLTDPVETLQQLSDGVAQAVSAEGVSTAAVDTVDFGEDGFSLEDTTPADPTDTGNTDTGGDTDDNDGAVQAEQGEQDDSTDQSTDPSDSTAETSPESSESSESSVPSTSDDSSSSATVEPSASSTAAQPGIETPGGAGGARSAGSAAGNPGPGIAAGASASLQALLDSARATSAQLETSDSYSSTGAYNALDGIASLADRAAAMLDEQLDAQLDAHGLTDGSAPEGSPPAMGAQAAQATGQIGARLVPALTEIGGMALGATITTAKRTLTPTNLSQIAAAGVTAGPQAAGAVTLAKFTEQGSLLLTPENASRFSARALSALQLQGLDEADIAKLAVSLANWKSLNEHTEYTNRPVMPDGRTAAQVTADWTIAAARDAGATGDTPSTTSSTAGDADRDSDRDADASSGTDRPALGETSTHGDYDTAAAEKAIASISDRGSNTATTEPSTTD